MKPLKYITLAFMVVLFVGAFSQESLAECDEINQTKCPLSSFQTQEIKHIDIQRKTTYVRKNVYHNSMDSEYANNPTRRPVLNSEGMATKTTSKTVRDGSMFGGDCSGGKCKDGSMFGGSCSIPKDKCYKACKENCGSPVKASCDRCVKDCSPCKKVKKTCNRCDEGFCTTSTVCPEDIGSVLDRNDLIKNYIKPGKEIYDALHKCQDLAPIELKYVDFRIKKDRSFTGFSNKLGNYRFRIFGCRRIDKTANLNEGRIMQKDLQFMEIFDDMMSDCYNITKTPKDICLPENKKPLPEYVVTAEITDYFMNLCDEYDWKESKKEDLRKGSSEMTVTWRVMDVTGKEVFWQGETVGYAEISEGEYNGEMVLLERAFADASNSLRNNYEFNEQLSQRISPKDMEAKRLELIELEKILNPTKCEYQKEIKIIEIEEKCGIKRVCKDIDTCTGEIVNEEISNIEIEDLGVEECSGLASSGNFVFEDGGSSSTASIYQRKEKTLVEEDGGSISVASSYEQKEKAFIDEDGGSHSSGAGAISESDAHQYYITGEIDEKGGYHSSGAGAIIDTSDSQYKYIDGIDEKGDVIVSNSMFGDEVWIDIPVKEEEQREIVEKSLFDIYNGLCIKDEAPYEELNAENVYKVRTSVVSIRNSLGVEGVGLVVSNNFIITSADLIVRENNRYDIKTINGTFNTASAFRINPEKNIALLVLEKETGYTPLSLNLDLPPVGRGGFVTLGMLNFADAEGKLDDKVSITSYRYSRDRTVNIVVNTNLQKTTIGGVLIDQHGTISGMSNNQNRTDNQDIFVPITDALKSVGLRVCDKPFPQQTPWYERATTPTPIAKAIEENRAKAPEVMPDSTRK